MWENGAPLGGNQQRAIGPSEMMVVSQQIAQVITRILPVAGAAELARLSSAETQIEAARGGAGDQLRISSVLRHILLRKLTSSST